jgi:uncharacterized membrane protein
MESKLVVLGFDSQFAAEGMLGDFERMQEEGLIQVEDAVVASRGVSTNIDIKQTRSKSGKFALRGSGVGLLAGLLLGGPILGLAGGAAIGAIMGGLKDSGIDHDFVDEVSEWLKPNPSALFLLAKEAKADQVLKRMEPFKAKVLTTTLTEEQEQRLQDILAREG